MSSSASITTTCSEGADVYRDDPMDDEAELRQVVGEPAVDRLLEVGGTGAVLSALDALRLLQGWVDDASCSDWLTAPQRRLSGRTPLEGLADGDDDEVLDVLRAYLAAQA